jgi:hypothetical protein
MKRRYEFLLLLAPCLVWWLATQCLSEGIPTPNRMILAALYTAFGAAALLTGRKLLGAFAMVGGLLFLGSVPVEHDIPDSAITLRLSTYDLSGSEPYSLDEMLRQNPSDLVALKYDGNLPAHPKSHPYTYTSCGDTGRTLLSRYPLAHIREQATNGGSRICGSLNVGNTKVGFVLLDISQAPDAQSARAVVPESLLESDAATIAVLDTGGAQRTLPIDWIQSQTGYRPSERPNQAFSGIFEGEAVDTTSLLLHSADLRCADFSQTTTGSFGTYHVGG